MLFVNNPKKVHMFKGGESNLTSVLFHYYLQLLNKRLFRRDTTAEVLDPGVVMCQLPHLLIPSPYLKLLNNRQLIQICCTCS